MPDPVLDLIAPSAPLRKNPGRENVSRSSGAFERELGGDIRAASPHSRSGDKGVRAADLSRREERAEAAPAEKAAGDGDAPSGAAETGMPVPVPVAPPVSPPPALALSADHGAAGESQAANAAPVISEDIEAMPARPAMAGVPGLVDTMADGESTANAPDPAMPNRPVQAGIAAGKAETLSGPQPPLVPEPPPLAGSSAGLEIARPGLEPLAALAREGVAEIRGRVISPAKPGMHGGDAGPAAEPDAIPARAHAQPKFAEIFAAAARGEAAFEQAGDGMAEPGSEQWSAALGQNRVAGMEQAIHRMASPPMQAAASASVPIAALAGEIASRAARGMTQFEIRLDPPELGRVDVRLEIDGEGRVTTRLTVERAETLELMKADQRALERALEQAGLRSGDGGLQFQLRDGRGGAADRGGPQDFSMGGGEGGDEDSLPAPPVQRGADARSAGVDIRI